MDNATLKDVYMFSGWTVAQNGNTAQFNANFFTAT